jgi:hypothetical protein
LANFDWRLANSDWRLAIGDFRLEIVYWHPDTMPSAWQDYREDFSPDENQIKYNFKIDYHSFDSKTQTKKRKKLLSG